MNDKITSHEIKAGLRVKFPAPGWQVFFEVGDDTGSKQRRWADAVAMGIWPSNGHEIHGMEIKVSRGDFLSEMRNPSKSHAVFRFCNRWSLVTPPGLVKVDELPATWGLMTFDGKSTRIVKQAPPLTPESLTAGFVAAMVRRAGEADDRLIAAAVAAESVRLRAGYEQQLTASAQRDRARRTMGTDGLKEQLDAYRRVFGNMPAWEIERLAPALKMLNALGLDRANSSVENVLRQMEHLSATVRPLLEAMKNPDPIFGDLM